jgi:PncC family amidohydrolase
VAGPGPWQHAGMDDAAPLGLSDDDAAARAVGEALLVRGERVAVVETTAGGLLSARLLSVPGASAWFDRGVVAYGGDSKQRFTSVDAELLRRHGAVSPEAVAAMAEGLRRESGVAWVVAESGIAGPQGSRRSSKPAGHCSIAVAGPGGVRSGEHHFAGSRTQVMAAIAQQCLRELAAALAEAPAPTG